jgi:hypothetical protein
MGSLAKYCQQDIRMYDKFNLGDMSPLPLSNSIMGLCCSGADVARPSHLLQGVNNDPGDIDTKLVKLLQMHNWHLIHQDEVSILEQSISRLQPRQTDGPGGVSWLVLICDGQVPRLRKG